VPRVTYNRFTQLGIRPGDAILADLGRIPRHTQVTPAFLKAVRHLTEDTVPVMLTVPQMDEAGVTATVEAMAERDADGLALGYVIGLVVAAANGDSVKRIGRPTPTGNIPVPIGERIPDGNDLRVMRHQRGWTQEELAEHAGLSHRIVSEVERGARTSEQTRLYLARTLTSR
jgi:DNA-binding XRE family transcriptional regulator